MKHSGVWFLAAMACLWSTTAHGQPSFRSEGLYVRGPLGGIWVISPQPLEPQPVQPVRRTLWWLFGPPPQASHD